MTVIEGKNGSLPLSSILIAMNLHHDFLQANQSAKGETHQERWSRAKQEKRLHEDIRDASADAARFFAALNGWRWSDSVNGFRIHYANGVGAYRDGVRFDAVFDHVIHFRTLSRPYRPVAIVGQPYGHVTPDKLAALYGKLDGPDEIELAWHVPPVPKASIHYPGETFFYVLTRPGATVRWLPEQSIGAG